MSPAVDSCAASGAGAPCAATAVAARPPPPPLHQDPPPSASWLPASLVHNPASLTVQERQRLHRCLQHALNNLYQTAEFSTTELDGIADALAPGRLPLPLLGHPHRTLLLGNYDVNVLEVALRRRGMVRAAQSWKWRPTGHTGWCSLAAAEPASTSPSPPNRAGAALARPAGRHF